MWSLLLTTSHSGQLQRSSRHGSWVSALVQHLRMLMDAGQCICTNKPCEKSGSVQEIGERYGRWQDSECRDLKSGSVLNERIAQICLPRLRPSLPRFAYEVRTHRQWTTSSQGQCKLTMHKLNQLAGGSYRWQRISIRLRWAVSGSSLRLGMQHADRNSSQRLVNPCEGEH